MVTGSRSAPPRLPRFALLLLLLFSCFFLSSRFSALLFVARHANPFMYTCTHNGTCPPSLASRCPRHMPHDEADERALSTRGSGVRPVHYVYSTHGCCNRVSDDFVPHEIHVRISMTVIAYMFFARTVMSCAVRDKVLESVYIWAREDGFFGERLFLSFSLGSGGGDTIFLHGIFLNTPTI